jgi:hypothetical protein
VRRPPASSKEPDNRKSEHATGWGAGSRADKEIPARAVGPLPDSGSMRIVGLVPAAPAAAGTPACARSTLLRLVAVATVHRTVTTWLEGHGGLLSAARTDDCRSSCFAPLVSASAPASACLLILLCLAARFAALGCRVAAFLEERLVFTCECKFLSAVATGQLQISSHGESSFPLYVRIPHSAVLVRLVRSALWRYKQRVYHRETASLRLFCPRSSTRNGRALPLRRCPKDSLAPYRE